MPMTSPFIATAIVLERFGELLAGSLDWIASKMSDGASVTVTKCRGNRTPRTAAGTQSGSRPCRTWDPVHR